MIDGLNLAIQIIEEQMRENSERYHGLMYSHVVNEPLVDILSQLRNELTHHQR